MILAGMILIFMCVYLGVVFYILECWISERHTYIYTSMHVYIHICIRTVDVNLCLCI